MTKPKKIKKIKGWATLKNGSIWRWYRDGSKRSKIFPNKEMAEGSSTKAFREKVVPCEIIIKSK